MWHKLEAQCNRRARCIEEYRVELENVEVLRSQAVEKELRRLVDDMVSTAYRMPGEIERIAEVKGPENAYKCFRRRNRTADNDSEEKLSHKYVCTCIIRAVHLHESALSCQPCRQLAKWSYTPLPSLFPPYVRNMPPS